MPGERSTSQEVPAEAEQAPDAASMQCWALPTTTSTQQFAGPTTELVDHAEISEAIEPAAPVAAGYSDQLQTPDAAASQQTADCMQATDHAHGSPGSDRSHLAAGIVAAAAVGTGKVTYPHLEVQAISQQNGQKPDKSDTTAQQANTTQLLNKRVQEWE